MYKITPLLYNGTSKSDEIINYFLRSKFDLYK